MKLKEAIKRISKKYGISYAILFGSYASKTQWKESDVDIAVKLKKTPKNFRENLRTAVKISDELGKVVKKEVDVVILNTADLGLKFEIFKTGKVLFCKDINELVEDKSKTIGMYHDFRIFVKPLYDKLIERFTGKED